jgi:hypothetical protein
MVDKPFVWGRMFKDSEFTHKEFMLKEKEKKKIYIYIYI